MSSDRIGVVPLPLLGADKAPLGVADDAPPPAEALVADPPPLWAPLEDVRGAPPPPRRSMAELLLPEPRAA